MLIYSRQRYIDRFGSIGPRLRHRLDNNNPNDHHNNHNNNDNHHNDEQHVRNDFRRIEQLRHVV